MSSIRKKQEMELLVTDMAFGGRGLARVEGMAVFVDEAVAGDRVRARIFKKKKRHAEAKALEVLSPSPDRVAPPCAYASWCGGCKWQYLSYEKQLEYKTRQVGEALEHLAGIRDVVIHPALPSPEIFHYRNKMEFTCTDSRWLLPEELQNPDIKKDSAIGLHVPGAFDRVLDIERCHIQPEMANGILAFIRKEILASGRPMYGLRSHEGFWRFVTLRHSVADDVFMVNLVTKEPDEALLKPLAERLREAFPSVTSVVNNVTRRKAGVAIGEEEILLSGEAAIYDAIGPFRFKISANSFFQTNTRAAEGLYAKTAEYAALSGGERVLDLYSGTGTIPIYLSEKASEITGIEIVESAVADARRNCLENGVENCRFLLGDMKDVLPGLDVKPDVIIIDPPRAGMHPDVVARILTLAPERMVYVSCNPATMARDLAMMKEAYEVLEVQPVDMFPHTFHIEAVARLRRKL
ncbi:23S rRNA (uracil(1939)-C(5))-methyltransferase RlmD [Desulfobotulus sp.]|jgi:23S rRNA (uracil1939-C5)-methyltransferase|uniref:23S rRNA (uracil(1939)-C(5))-methyltransferase RlmD n=1 Tax=Desulfobotulus sp. TaxID=1940337 RepID=UPI002A3701BD|nr:23S rRNA (uracil(1939)-C(5))-methyltransferase RlmD [Desulfobotulus sp.]MDY0161847.1 23S rRNA (uracil(1939)-C(5))-methyltransferase RlmD [Desulfobotulus sp.]